MEDPTEPSPDPVRTDSCNYQKIREMRHQYLAHGFYVTPDAYFGQNGQPFRSKAASVSDQRGQVNAAERRWV